MAVAVMFFFFVFFCSVGGDCGEDDPCDSSRCYHAVERPTSKEG